MKGSSVMFGDNESVVNSTSMPHGKLHKQHAAASWHRIREAAAAGWVKFNHIAGKLNPADILSKHWDMPSVWPTLKPLMFWGGDTADLIDLHSEVPDTDDNEDEEDDETRPHQGE